MTTPEQLAKSQKAFEAKFPAMEFAMYTPTQYKDNFTESCFCVWQAAETFARKQALEDAIAIFRSDEVKLAFNALSKAKAMVQELLND